MVVQNKVIVKEIQNNNCKTTQNGIYRHKEFQARNSLLTDLFEINHFSTLRHCCIISMILIVMYTVFREIVEPGSLQFGFRYVKSSFNKFHTVIAIWTGLFICTLLVHPAFCIWAKYRATLNPKCLLVKLWDRLWLLTLLIYVAIFLYVPPCIKSYYNLNIASTAVVIMEQLRMVMKTHAFVKCNVPFVRSFKEHSDNDLPIPEFSKYLYYLFIPTLIYRNEYPRTKEIRWSFVAMNFLEVAAIIYFFNFLAEHFLVSQLGNFGLEPYNWQTIILSIFRMLLPAVLILVCTFYLILHSWMNAWAEMLKFADRLFYADWWNSTNYNTYYRKWNFIVHEYLHTYIYRDLYEIVLPGNKPFATFAVLLTSAIAHEYIFVCAFGFFFPVMLIQFAGLGMMWTYVKMDRQFIGNSFFIWSLCLGIGIQVSLYTMEMYARINCPKMMESFGDYLVPRLLSCNNNSI